MVALALGSVRGVFAFLPRKRVGAEDLCAWYVGRRLVWRPISVPLRRLWARDRKHLVSCPRLSGERSMTWRQRIALFKFYSDNGRNTLQWVYQLAGAGAFARLLLPAWVPTWCILAA